MSVNPNTVQRVYQELEREGVSETRRGTGTYIVENDQIIPTLRAEMANSVTEKFIAGMRALGLPDGEIVAELKKKIAGGTH
jgi:GntR family transcriptional regulator